MYFPCDFLNNISSSFLYCENTVYDAYNIQNMRWSIVYVMGKASSQQEAIS